MANRTPAISDLSSLFDEWRAAPSDWDRINRLVQGVSVALENKSLPVESSEHKYRARSMRALLMHIESAREGNSFDEVIGYAFALGMEVASSTTKLKREESWIHGEGFRDSQSAKGSLRWSKDEAQTILAEIINKLSRRVDAMGESLKPNELWPELFAEMDARELAPLEHDDPKQYTSPYLNKPYTYEAFRKRMSRAR